MIRVYLEDLTETGVGDGYCCDGEIFIEASLPYERIRLTAVHEVLDYYLSGRVRHGKIDQMAIDVIDALIQIGSIGDRQIPDNPHKEIQWK